MSRLTNEIKVQEVFAFLLFCESGESKSSETEQLAREWRSSGALRAKWRNAALLLSRNLENMGAKIALRSSDTLDKTIQILETEPAAKVYRLEDDISPTYGSVLPSED